MSKRIDITGKIFGDIFVLEFEKNANTHATYKCLCMCCNKIIYVTYSNLVNKNTKSCQSCGNKRVNYIQEAEIAERLARGDKKAHIAKDMDISRYVVYRVEREFRQ